MGGEAAPHLYILGKKDGLGATAHSTICGMAVAAKWGMNFGGVVQGAHASHGIRVGRAVQELLGLTWNSRIFVQRSRVPDLKVFSHIEQLEMVGGDFAKAGLARANLLLNSSTPQYEFRGEAGYNSYMTEEFLAALRSQVMPSMKARPLEFGRSSSPSTDGSPSPWVALHVRRGDVTGRDEARYTPDEWYFQVVQDIRGVWPGADIHAWSSTEGAKEDLAGAFEGFRQRGITVHLDGDPLDAWANFMAAHVFVMARSTFSKVPALLNRGCVIYQAMREDRENGYYLWRWFEGTNESRAEYQSDLQKCVTSSMERRP